MCVSTVADGRTEQEPIADAIFEIRQGGSVHDALANSQRAGRHLPARDEGRAIVTAGEWESLPSPPSEPRCAVEGRLAA
eukprot:9463023-Alexandrium_andersonii.AAC.1